MVKIAIVDDHTIVRLGIKTLLESLNNFKVVSTFCCGEDLLRWCRTESVDIIIMDIEMPGLSGLDTISKLKRLAPEVPIIVLTMHIKGYIAQKILNAGVDGFLSKSSVFDELILAVKVVFEGGKYINPALAQNLIWFGDKSCENNLIDKLKQLSSREMQILNKIIEGENIQKIASVYSLSEKTVHTYRHRMFKKLDVKNDIELMRFAIKAGLIKDKVI